MLGKVGFYFFDKLIEEHLHDGEIIFELVHDLVSDVVIDKQFVLFFGEGLAVDLSLFQPNIAFVSYHALPL